jgi:hypothetical protein
MNKLESIIFLMFFSWIEKLLWNSAVIFNLNTHIHIYWKSSKCKQISYWNPNIFWYFPKPRSHLANKKIRRSAINFTFRCLSQFSEDLIAINKEDVAIFNEKCKDPVCINAVCHEYNANHRLGYTKGVSRYKIEINKLNYIPVFFTVLLFYLIFIFENSDPNCNLFWV